MSTFFISHSSKDNGAAARLRDQLAARQYRSLFLDFDPADGIPVGQSWERTLYRKLQACEVVLVLFSDNHLASNWCFAEVALARMQGKPVVPLLIDPLKSEKSLPSVMGERQWLDLRGEAGDAAFDKLFRDLAELDLDDRPGGAWDTRRAPYPGLSAFDEGDAPIFFGRGKETRQIVEQLNANQRRDSVRLLTVLGGSGSGKSSVVRAGVVPRLRRDPRWRVIDPFRPGRQPVEELAIRLARAYGLAASAVDELIAEVGRTSLVEVLERLQRRSDRPDATVLLVIDQLEELLGVTSPSAEDFLRVLDECCAGSAVAVQMLATLRSDYLGELQGQRELPHLLQAQQTVMVGPMDREALRLTISKPAQLAAVELEDGLVDRLLDDMGTTDALPVLAFALRVLWDRGHEDGQLKIEEYNSLGGLGQVLSQEADAVLAAACRREPGIHKLLQEAFVRMSRLGGNGGYSRAPTAWTDHPQAVRPALQRFVERRILSTRQGTGEATVEIAHEALFRAWAPLAQWLIEASDVLRLSALLRDSCARWHLDHDTNDLMRGTRLGRVRELAMEGRIVLRDDEKQFLEASEQAERQRMIDEGNTMGAVLADPRLREALEPRLKPIVEELLAEQKRKDFHDVDGVRLNDAIQAVQNLQLKQARWHPQDAVVVSNTGTRGNYIDVLQFPCCGLQVLGENTVTQFRADGCQDYDPTLDKPALKR